MIERVLCETVFREAVVACDPASRVAETLARQPVRGREVIGLAVGKAAVAMARGAGPVARGLVITVDGVPLSNLPSGWTATTGDHPVPSHASLMAGAEAVDLVASAKPDDVLLALISGGASALVEQPKIGLDQYGARVRDAMAKGVPIQELNRLRTELSWIKGGQLAAKCKAPVVTLLVSDVIGDDPHVIGSGLTVRDGDRVEIVAPMALFGDEVVEALSARFIKAHRSEQPIADDVVTAAARLARDAAASNADAIVAWGEPTLRIPEQHGAGGRAQQLALELARHLRGTDRCAFVAGSDGIDGSSARGAAGAYVDGTTWDAIIAAKIDPAAALARCDAGTALDAVGALVVTGPTGINHADVVIIG